MVVLFVVGLMVSLVAINIDDDVDSLVRIEAQRFSALARLAADESIVQGKAIGIDLSSDATGYQFLIFNNGKWLPNSGTAELRQRELQHGIRIKLLHSEAGLLNVRNEDVVKPEQDDSTKSTNNSESADLASPEIILTPVGIISSFEFLFFLDKVAYSVKSNQDSDFSVALVNAGN
jgi:hypothetical protein